MNRKILKRILLGGLILCVVGAAVIWSLLSEPQYEGKPLSYWLQQSVTTTNTYGSTSMNFTPEAVDAIHAIGTDAIPFLVETGFSDPSLIDEGRRRFSFWPGARARMGEQFESRILAMNALFVLGTNATSPLLEMIEIDNLKSEAVQALGFNMPDARAVPALLHCLLDENERVQTAAVNTLDRYLRYDVRTQIELAEGPNGSTAYTGIFQNLGGKSHPIIPLLRERAADPNPIGFNGYFNMVILHQMTPGDPVAIKALSGVLEHKPSLQPPVAMSQKPVALVQPIPPQLRAYAGLLLCQTTPMTEELRKKLKTFIAEEENDMLAIKVKHFYDALESKAATPTE